MLFSNALLCLRSLRQPLIRSSRLIALLHTSCIASTNTLSSPPIEYPLNIIIERHYLPTPAIHTYGVDDHTISLYSSLPHPSMVVFYLSVLLSKMGTVHPPTLQTGSAGRTRFLVGH